HAGMAACYHRDVRFSDPAFTDLRGWRAGAMWRMLCERAKDFELTFSDIDADDHKGVAHWEARYTFSATGQKVHNIIDAQFTFRDGLIVTHDDRFDFYRWASQALGFKGKLLGWLPPVQNAIRKQANGSLDAYISKRGLSAADFGLGGEAADGA
ncbi:MAG: nuclear transport factor 2 family protein, partial [Myxococcota bacterium]